ncbi:MAG: tail fiber protein [Candidatus Eremiobacteraeota bacterium]|nr:tail fiber protein [Candidatus Eremiobacteraeota bacterium]MBV8645509.1 tail fiber protein [Candidatus Eremiobacteraeota bacterium]
MRHIKRTSFLGASAAALLAGCGRAHGASSLLPAVTSPAGGARSHETATPADPIPDSVLRSPIVGEARRFDGAVAPPGWIFVAGQTLTIAQFPRLHAVIGRDAGHGTFTLPQPHESWIIAVAGFVPTSPRALASLHRGANDKYGVSLQGVTVRPAPVRPLAVQRPDTSLPTWYPGTLATKEQLAAQRR